MSIPLTWRLGAGFAVSATILGLQTATARRPDLHARLLGALGLNWPALRAFQFHRIPGSALIQPSPGFSLAGVVGAALAPIAAWRLGTRWMALVFFGADALSTLSILAALRAAHAAGVCDTEGLTHGLDAGSSSAATATVAALCVTRGRPGRIAVVAGALALTRRLVRRRQLEDFQHALAGIIGAALGLLYLARPRDTTEHETEASR